MPQFEVAINEWSRTFEAPTVDSEPTPLIRDVVSTFETEDEERAKRLAWLVWMTSMGRTNAQKLSTAGTK
jgi:hypothetical protein